MKQNVLSMALVRTDAFQVPDKSGKMNYSVRATNGVRTRRRRGRRGEKKRRSNKKGRRRRSEKRRRRREKRWRRRRKKRRTKRTTRIRIGMDRGRSRGLRMDIRLHERVGGVWALY
jgi:hypothetical protein